MAAIDISDVISRSKHGDTVALQQLAKAYHSGEYNIEQDTGEMIEVYLPFAERGDLAAQYLVAIAYIDYSEDKKYIQWLQKSADAGFTIAQSQLGSDYVYGDYIKQNFKKAIYYLTLAAHENEGDAQFELGQLYQEGQGVEKNYIEAAKWFELAAQQKNENAFVSLGLMFELGNGFEKNYLKATEYYLKAAELENIQVLEFLSELYEIGGYGLDADPEKAAYYLELWEDLKF